MTGEQVEELLDDPALLETIPQLVGHAGPFVGHVSQTALPNRLVADMNPLSLAWNRLYSMADSTRQGCLSKATQSTISPSFRPHCSPFLSRLANSRSTK